MRLKSEACWLLRAEIVKRGLTYKGLARRLQSIGVEETHRSIGSKISRGTFSFEFFLQCLKALGAKAVTIDLEAFSKGTPTTSPATRDAVDGAPAVARSRSRRSS